MSNTQKRITMNDIEAVGYGKLLLGAIIGLPVGAVLGFIFAIIWLALLPAGDITLVMIPVIGGISGLIIAPLILVRKKWRNRRNNVTWFLLAAALFNRWAASAKTKEANMKTSAFALTACLIVSASLGLGCSKPTSSQPETANTATEVTVGTSKKDVLNRLGNPKAWFELKPGAGLRFVSYFTPGSTERPMPADEIWFFEYEKPVLCIWLKGEVVIEVKKESCTKDNSNTSSSPTTTQSNSNSPSQNADVESRYKWQSKSDIPVPADGITVMEVKNGSLKIGAAEGGAGSIPFGGDDVVIDTPGSRDVRIEIDPKVKKTTYAGLVFITPCILEIFDDTTLIANQEGIVAKDKKGKQWKSRKVTLDNKEVIAFFPSE